LIKVHPKLWLSNRMEITNIDLKGLVDVIVYLGQEMNEPSLTHGNSLPVIHFPLNDGHNPKSKYIVLNGILSYLTNVRNARVCLACRYGQSRSPAIAIAYLMRSEGFEFSYAFMIVSRRVKGFLPKQELLEDIKGLEATL